MTAFAAILALCVVIIIHEFGHYIAAVVAGMHVDRFSLFGIGPPIVKLGRWRGTEFVISAIPFGAYVQIRGMEADDGSGEAVPAPPGKIAFRDASVRARMAVIAGGPVFNYLFAMLVLFGVYTTAGVAGPVVAIEIRGVHDGSAAAAAGLQPGDRVLAVAGTPIDPAQEARDIGAATQANLGGTIAIEVERDGQPLALEATLPAEGDAPLGVDLAKIAPREHVDLGVAASRALADPWRDTANQLEGLYLLATGKLKASMQGPVGIVRSIAREADVGVVPFVLMVAFISTLLGMFNLLPLPALDGGRLAFLTYEGIARRRASPRVEELVHGYGMVALLALLALVTIGDVRRLF
ncbi:MAG: site-2 protease family protein [Deltaproteobacteria bacterium]|nr:site-2 protease family protein [Deltaproteobacteria bacterium]MBK8714981.1 site-2 protease family protein [Deltaproteobacteria bacterium]MBP7290436.1 site-2 protease family protein [Nannocystaceae bacterium]